jgi:hypothetical protein
MLDEFDLDLRLGELHTPTATADRPAQEGAPGWETGAAEDAPQPRAETEDSCFGTCGEGTCQTCDTCNTCGGETCEGTCFGETCEGTCEGVTCTGTCEGATCDVTCEGITCETCQGDTCPCIKDP